MKEGNGKRTGRTSFVQSGNQGQRSVQTKQETPEKSGPGSTSKRAKKQVEMKSLSGGRSIYGRTIKKSQRCEQ